MLVEARFIDCVFQGEPEALALFATPSFRFFDAIKHKPPYIRRIGISVQSAVFEEMCYPRPMACLLPDFAYGCNTRVFSRLNVPFRQYPL
jgi:hypothetical protein